MKKSLLLVVILVLAQFSNTFAQGKQQQYSQLKADWLSLPELVENVSSKTLELKSIYKGIKPFSVGSPEFAEGMKSLRDCSVKVDRLRNEVGDIVTKLYFVTDSDKFDATSGLTEKQWKEIKGWNKKAYKVAASMNQHNDTDPSVWEISNFLLEHGS